MMAKKTAQELDLSEAVDYHYDGFPPTNIDKSRLIEPLVGASAALARYDQMLKGMLNSELFLAPLLSQEAVVSSRMEGTVSTLEEVLQYEADHEEDGEQAETAHRSEAIEVYFYSRAMSAVQRQMEEGAPLSSWLMRSAHKVLLRVGRGATMSPGEYKTEQNYLADRIAKKVLFVPIRPEQLTDGIERLFEFIENSEEQDLIRTAIAHLEFEALHPFKDGNGRIGRMLITLMLWKYGIISAPHFYVSRYFEEHRDEYIDTMRAVSQSGDWTDWIVFFLNGLEAQAQQNLEKAEEIKALYDRMKDVFRDVLSSQWSTNALDFVFSTPVFRNNAFTRKSGIPTSTAQRITKALLEQNLLITVSPASGRRAAMHAFEPLLKIVRS